MFRRYINGICILINYNYSSAITYVLNLIHSYIGFYKIINYGWKTNDLSRNLLEYTQKF